MSPFNVPGSHDGVSDVVFFLLSTVSHKTSCGLNHNTFPITCCEFNAMRWLQAFLLHWCGQSTARLQTWLCWLSDNTSAFVDSNFHQTDYWFLFLWLSSYRSISVSVIVQSRYFVKKKVGKVKSGKQWGNTTVVKKDSINLVGSSIKKSLKSGRGWDSQRTRTHHSLKRINPATACWN